MKGEHQSCFNQMKKVYIVTWKPEFTAYYEMDWFSFILPQDYTPNKHLKRKSVKHCSYRYAKLKITYVTYRRCFRRKPNWLCLSHIYNPYQQSETLPNTSINPNLWYHVVPWDNIVEMNFSSSLYKLNVCTLYFIFSPNPRAFHRLVANLHN